MQRINISPKSPKKPSIIKTQRGHTSAEGRKAPQIREPAVLRRQNFAFGTSPTRTSPTRLSPPGFPGQNFSRMRMQVNLREAPHGLSDGHPDSGSNGYGFQPPGLHLIRDSENRMTMLNDNGDVIYGAIGKRVWERDSPQMISGLRSLL